MNIPQAIMHLYPQANPMTDFVVQDDSDGKGAYIAQWNLKDESGKDITKPTDSDLQTAWDAMQLPSAKQQKNEELSSKCNAAVLAGFTSSALGVAHTYDFDYEAQMNLGGMLNAINAGISPDSIVWKTVDAGPLPHTQTQFKQLFVDGLTHKNNTIEQYWTKKSQVAAATTIDQVNAITWGS